MTLMVDVALAAPLWQPLTYAVPAELAPLVKPLARLLVPLRGGARLGFALGEPQPVAKREDQEGLKTLLDVLEDGGQPQAWPPELLPFFQRAAAYYHAPLGQVLAWCLPAGMGSARPAKALAPKTQQVAVVSWRRGEDSRLPRPESQAARILRRLKARGPLPLPELRAEFPRAAALCRDLEKRGWVTISHRPLVKDLLGRPLLPEPEPEHYTPDQQRALDELLPAVRSGGFRSFLLHGVTGSGKTELYMACVKAALEAGRTALLLTPEIGLCLRLEGLLRQRFGAGQVAVLHSGLSPAARRGQWLAIAGGRARVVVGARSAVFAPLREPGVICVDEEQDEAYKQEDRFRYHARDLALLRGRQQGCPVVLGTATPAVTTYHRAQEGNTVCLRLPRRVRQAPLPRMELVDLRREGRLVGGFLSRRLLAALEQTLKAGEQAILFLNRRGFAPAYLCTACGQTVGCPACAVSLTLHQASDRLICHVCGHQRPRPRTCPACGAGEEKLRPLGLGTEAVAQKLGELLPGARIARLDRDTAGDPRRLGELLRAIAERRVQVVVGTQMITKGHDFPGIGLVGVLSADQALALPDFRAGERAYGLLTQVAGRAGRQGGKSRVIVQAYDPDHHALRAALAQRPEEFYQTELAERRALGYPPFMRLVALRLEAVDDRRCQRAARALAAGLEEARRRLEPGARVLGPAPAALPRAKARHRWMLLLKAPGAAAAGRVLRLGLHRSPPLPAGVRLVVDVDPVSLI